MKAGRTSALLFMLLSLPAQAADPGEKLITSGKQRLQDNAKAQQTINRLADQTDNLAARYEQLSFDITGLNAYARLLEQQVGHQQQRIDQLQADIEQSATVDRQILP